MQKGDTVQVLVFFNELSGNADAATDANALLGDLVAVLREVRRRRPGASLIAPDLMEHKVKTDVTVRDLHAGRSRDQVRWLMQQCNRAPFLRTQSPDESGVEYRHGNLVARGPWCHSVVATVLVGEGRGYGTADVDGCGSGGDFYGS